MSGQYDKELASWQAEMDTNLRADYSWLALWGLFWLDEGLNTIGSAAGSKVQLPERVKAKIGSFSLSKGKVAFLVEPGIDIRLNNDEDLSSDRVLGADVSGKPDFLFVEDIRFTLIERGDQLAIRVWDPQHSKRKNFAGRKWFETSESYRVKARIESYDPPKPVRVDDIIGIQHKAEMHAALVFELDGQEQQLEAELRESGAYYVIFKDQTAGETTYPSGRYMLTEIAENGQVVIDFNRAYNPPCAFTDHATCPLPRPENVLSIAIEAGERYLEQSDT